MNDHATTATDELDAAQTRALLAALANTIIEHAAELSELDRAIGDGDHGVNMARGFGAVREHLDEYAGLPLGKAFTEVGKRLVMTVGGASGPLYGTFFMVLGERLTAAGAISTETVVAALEAAVDGVERRGKAQTGQKTLLDVLVPVRDTLRAGGPDLLARLAASAQAAALATTPMRAQRGRAAFLGERSIGHLDPGARSSQLLIAAACGALRSRSGESHAG